MSSDEELDALLKALARRAAPGPSIAGRVMNLIDASAPASAAGAPPLPAAAGRWRKALRAAAATGLAAGLALGLGLSWLLARGGAAPSAGVPVPIQVTDVAGTVLVQRAPDRAWHELASAAPLYAGDVFQAGPRAELRLSFQDGSTLVLTSGTRLALEQCDGGIRLNLASGTLHAALRSPHPPFTVSTPAGRIEALGTEFTVTVE